MRPLAHVAICLIVCATHAGLAIPATENAPSPEENGAVTAGPTLLLGPSYPIETLVSFHAALFHWVDSLAGLEGTGLTAGKTIAAHRLDFRDVQGKPSEQDLEMLGRFAGVRARFIESRTGEEKTELVEAFFEATSLAEALDRSKMLVGDDGAAELGASLRHFAPYYEKVWKDGRIPQRFVQRSLEDSRREELARFLVDVARFFGVSPGQEPAPRLILAPVRRGYGTHAQAVGRHLLIEIRDGEGLIDEVPPIVHENAHFLYHKIPESRRAAWEARAIARGAEGRRAWQLLHEALPTAIAQGVAAERFLGRREWLRRPRWYHVESIDRYARQLYPLVKQTLASGGTLNDAFIDRALELWSSPATPRSP